LDIIEIIRNKERIVPVLPKHKIKYDDRVIVNGNSEKLIQILHSNYEDELEKMFIFKSKSFEEIEYKELNEINVDGKENIEVNNENIDKNNIENIEESNKEIKINNENNENVENIDINNDINIENNKSNNENTDINNFENHENTDINNIENIEKNNDISNIDINDIENIEKNNNIQNNDINQNNENIDLNNSNELSINEEDKNEVKDIPIQLENIIDNITIKNIEKPQDELIGEEKKEIPNENNQKKSKYKIIRFIQSIKSFFDKLKKKDDIEKDGLEFFEVVIGTESKLLHQQVNDENFKQIYNASIIAFRRKNDDFMINKSKLEFKVGDTLLLLSKSSFYQRYINSKEFFVISRLDSSKKNSVLNQKMMSFGWKKCSFKIRHIWIALLSIPIFIAMVIAALCGIPM
jgi:K+/H+ antiporter YhaU regulatory subunit KhtT